MEAIQAHSVAVALLHLLEGQDRWEGTATELKSQLEQVAEKLKIDVNTKSARWPKAPHALVRRLNEIRTNFREEGWGFECQHSGGRKIIFYRTHEMGENTVQSVQSVQGQADQGVKVDATVDGTDATPAMASTRKSSNSLASDAMDGTDAISRTSTDQDNKLREVTI